MKQYRAFLVRLAAVVMGAGCVLMTITYVPQSHVQAQIGPSMLVPNLDVRTVVSDLTQPTSMAFIGPNQFFVLEKASGQVKLVSNGAVTRTVLDLGVNNSSERGLLGIALHPNFPTNRGVYLYWTCQVPPPDPSDPFAPV